jgi:hypothetical protein
VTVIEARSPPKDCRSSKTPSPELVEDNGAPWHAIRNKKHHFKGASYGFFRVAQQPLATAHDHLAAQLIYEIGEKSSGDAQLVLSYLRHLPVRLSQSRALFDSLTVFCDTWANYQRGDAPDKLINPRLYSRAIHTIQKAITGPLQLKAETLAAITTLQRMEILFDADRGSHRSIHYSGILALVQKKGPPNLEDALDVEIAIENQSTAVSVPPSLAASSRQNWANINY